MEENDANKENVRASVLGAGLALGTAIENKRTRV